MMIVTSDGKASGKIVSYPLRTNISGDAKLACESILDTGEA
jgi:hypothetical protein